MLIYNKTNCSILINNTIIERYSTKNVDISRDDKQIRFLLANNSIAIVDNGVDVLNNKQNKEEKVELAVSESTTKNKNNKKANKNNKTNTINNINTISKDVKSENSENNDKKTLGDEE